jgi:hypothetical protein
MIIKKQISRIKEIIESFTKNSYNLPEKPNEVLFNDFWLSQLDIEGDYVKFGIPRSISFWEKFIYKFREMVGKK